MPQTWQDILDGAESEHAVVRIVREFVAAIDPFELASLPPPCRPGKFVDAADVTDFAFEVVRHQCADNEPARHLVHKIAAFFSHASARLSRIMARTNDTETDDVKSA